MGTWQWPLGPQLHGAPGPQVGGEDTHACPCCPHFCLVQSGDAADCSELPLLKPLMGHGKLLESGKAHYSPALERGTSYKCLLQRPLSPLVPERLPGKGCSSREVTCLPCGKPCKLSLMWGQTLPLLLGGLLYHF